MCMCLLSAYSMYLPFDGVRLTAAHITACVAATLTESSEWTWLGLPAMRWPAPLQGVIQRREVDVYSFTLPPYTNSSRPFRVLLVMRTVDGDAQL